MIGGRSQPDCTFPPRDLSDIMAGRESPLGTENSSQWGTSLQWEGRMKLRCCWVLVLVLGAVAVYVYVDVTGGGQEEWCRIVEDGSVTWEGPCSRMPDLQA